MIIAIFEDHPADAEQLKDICSRWGRKNSCSIKLWVFETVKQLEDELLDRRQYDFYFLDIMTPKDPSAGFRLAERIRRADERAPIVFTTNSREYIESAFEISASQYDSGKISENQKKSVNSVQRMNGCGFHTARFYI